MNDVSTIEPRCDSREAGVAFALLQCTSMYPTPYEAVNLGAIEVLAQAFPDAVVGLSDHSMGIYTSLGAVPLGARILEKHFTSDKSWPGPDVPISLDPTELSELVRGSRAVFEARGRSKTILPGEKPTIDFAYARRVIRAIPRAARSHGQRLGQASRHGRDPGQGLRPGPRRGPSGTSPRTPS
jgi:N-acetylneuraminate synthase